MTAAAACRARAGKISFHLTPFFRDLSKKSCSETRFDFTFLLWKPSEQKTSFLGRCLGTNDGSGPGKMAAPPKHPCTDGRTAAVRAKLLGGPGRPCQDRAAAATLTLCHLVKSRGPKKIGPSSKDEAPSRARTPLAVHSWSVSLHAQTCRQAAVLS